MPSTSPRLLTSPPSNYGAVQAGQIFRSAFPQPSNISFLRGLRIKTVLCLVDTKLSPEFLAYMEETTARRIRLDIAPNKNGLVCSTLSSIYDALLVVLDVANYPLHIHCNQGKHRTGCVVACFRRLQGWTTSAALEEYETYASPKTREGDIRLIQDFDPDAMLEYVKHVHFDHRPSLMHLLRSDLVNVEMLVRILASPDGIALEHESLKSNASTRADSGVEIWSPEAESEAMKVILEDTQPLDDDVEMKDA